MGRLSCIMPVCLSMLHESSRLDFPYLVTKSTHAGPNRLLNDVETIDPQI